jgi:alkylation response protein AidB-like acyl-CoA dehydrogenase
VLSCIVARRAVTALKDTFVPDPDVVLQRRVSKSGRITKVFAKAPFTIGAPYTGIAVSARDFTVEFMRERPRFPLKNPMSHLPAVYNKVGEMDLLIEGARAAMWKAPAEVDADDPASWSRKAVAARMIAVENSVRVVDMALRAVGGSVVHNCRCAHLTLRKRRGRLPSSKAEREVAHG